MPRELRAYLGDILSAIEHTLQFTDGKEIEDYGSDFNAEEGRGA